MAVIQYEHDCITLMTLMLAIVEKGHLPWYTFIYAALLAQNRNVTVATSIPSANRSVKKFGTTIEG